MEKKVELVLLYETYKSLLTTHKCTIFELYYFSDLSYREIADNKGISYQAVRDTLKKTEKDLYEYEDKLNLANIKFEIERIKEYLMEDDNNNCLDQIKQIIEEIEV